MTAAIRPEMTLTPEARAMLRVFATRDEIREGNSPPRFKFGRGATGAMFELVRAGLVHENQMRRAWISMFTITDLGRAELHRIGAHPQPGDVRIDDGMFMLRIVRPVDGGADA